MYHNASQCITMYCITMYHNVSQCIIMYHNISQCITIVQCACHMCHNVSQCITIYHNVSQLRSAHVTCVTLRHAPLSRDVTPRSGRHHPSYLSHHHHYTFTKRHHHYTKAHHTACPIYYLQHGIMVRVQIGVKITPRFHYIAMH